MSDEAAKPTPISQPPTSSSSGPSNPHTTIRSALEPTDAPWTTSTLPPVAVAIPAPTSTSTSALMPSPQQPPSAKLSNIGAGAKTQYNTHNLGWRIGADAVAAGSAGVLVAPIITMIDKGIIENASGRASLKESLKRSVWEFVSRPLRFVGGKPFGLIFTLYFGTYFTANTLDTASSTLHSTPATATTSGTPKFLATSTANLALCLYKDSRFTQLFGSPSAPRRPVPLPTFALFTIRDALTIFASFNVPPLLAPHLAAHMSEQTQRVVGAASVAQFVAPAAVQVFSTPLHLLGLDLYNRPGAGAEAKIKIWGEGGRARRVLRDWGMSTVARMGRIVPAFGVGGVVNMKVRRGLMGALE